MQFIVTAQRLTTAPGGWSGSISLPAFTLEAASEDEALVKAGEIVGPDTTLCVWSPDN